MTEKVILELIKSLPTIIAAIGAVTSVIVGVNNSYKLRGNKQEIADTRAVVDSVHTLMKATTWAVADAIRMLTKATHMQMEERLSELRSTMLNLTDCLARAEQNGQSAADAQAKTS